MSLIGLGLDESDSKDGGVQIDCSEQPAKTVT
jgi:hypothetical protein